MSKNVSGTTAARPPAWFWIVAGLALLWNLLGVAAYLAEAYGMAQSHERGSLVDARPAWVTGAFALAVFGGTLGCIALLIRHRFAFVLLAASFTALLVQQAWNLTSPGAEVAMEGPALGFAGAVVLVSLSLLFLARLAMSSGWLR